MTSGRVARRRRSSRSCDGGSSSSWPWSPDDLAYLRSLGLSDWELDELAQGRASLVLSPPEVHWSC